MGLLLVFAATPASALGGDETQTAPTEIRVAAGPTAVVPAHLQRQSRLEQQIIATVIDNLRREWTTSPGCEPTVSAAKSAIERALGIDVVGAVSASGFAEKHGLSALELRSEERLREPDYPDWMDVAIAFP